MSKNELTMRNTLGSNNNSKLIECPSEHMTRCCIYICYICNLLLVVALTWKNGNGCIIDDWFLFVVSKLIIIVELRLLC